MSETVIMPETSGLGGLGGGIGGLLIGALLGSRGGLFGNNWGSGVGGPAAAAVAADVVLNPAFQSLQNQISNLSNEVDSNQILAGITSVNQNISGTSRDIGRDIAGLATSQAQGNFTTLTSINGLGRDITAAQTQALINSLQNFNTLQGNLTTSTNQIIAQGTALAAQSAQCCCEVKQAIANDGNETRALINALNVQNLTAQLNDAKSQISNSAQTNALIAAMAQQTNVLIQHLHPVPVVS